MPSTSVGTSPSWIHAATTPTTGIESVPSPAAPAGSACSANSQRNQATALASTTV